MVLYTWKPEPEIPARRGRGGGCNQGKVYSHNTVQYTEGDEKNVKLSRKTSRQINVDSGR